MMPLGFHAVAALAVHPPFLPLPSPPRLRMLAVVLLSANRYSIIYSRLDSIVSSYNICSKTDDSIKKRKKKKQKEKENKVKYRWLSGHGVRACKKRARAGGHSPLLYCYA